MKDTIRKTAGGALVVIGIAAGPLWAQSAEEIAAQIDQQIAADPMLSQYGLDAEASGESVVLTGSAPSEEEKEMLGQVIGGMAGGLSIDNQVTVE